MRRMMFFHLWERHVFFLACLILMKPDVVKLDLVTLLSVNDAYLALMFCYDEYIF